MPNDDILSGHSFDVGSRPGQMLMFDTRSNTLLKTIPVPWQGQDIWDNLDARRDRDLVAFFDAPVMLVIDAHSGRVLRTVRACTSQSGPVISQRTQRIFVSCADGRILVFDSATYQLVASRNPTAIGTAAYKTILVDEATRRVFLPGASGYGVLDARTGAVLRTLPLLNWWVGTQDILPGSHDVVMAPFVPPSLGQPPHAVLVLDGRSGAILHRWRVPENPLQVLVNPLTGHVLVASAGPWDISGAPDSGGTVSVLDAHTGAIVQQIRTGVLPGGLAADPRTRHLFVMNFNTNNDGQSLVRTYPDGWWPQFQRQLKKGAGWLPFTAPAPPSPPVYATVMMLDLAML
jgi:DNA-binding beta-propeller fold protein YncE